MNDLLKLNPGKLALFRRQPGSSLLGLSFDGGRLEVVHLARTNGSIEVRNTLSVSLSLDPLTDDAELVGREIRKHLDAAEVRERWCVVCVPLSWALTHTTKLPELSEADLEGFLQIEAERGFPYSPETLMLSRARQTAAGGESYMTLVGIPRDHVTRLEAALRAAQLRPVSFSLGIVALRRDETDSLRSVVSLVPGENNVGLLVSSGGGVAVLRTIEGAYELQGGEKLIQGDHVAREVRITLGQLPVEVRDSIQRLEVFGHGDAAVDLVEQLEPRVRPMGMAVEPVRDYAPSELGVRIPTGTPVSGALSLALRYLTGRTTGFEFLPPKISAWKQFSDRYASRKLTSIGVTAGAVAVLIVLALLVQQWQLSRWRAKWLAMKPRVTELDAMQQEIRRFRPWFDESFRSLSILRQLTEAFPEDGAVAAKSVEIRDPSMVACSGTARDHQALLVMLDKLRTAKEITAVQVEQIRGKSPLQFSFNFKWNAGGGP